MSAPEGPQPPAAEEVAASAAESPPREEAVAVPDSAESGSAESGSAESGSAESGSGVPGSGVPGSTEPGSTEPGSAEHPQTGTAPASVRSPDGDRRQVRTLFLVAGLALVLVASSVGFGMAWSSARESGPTANQAFVDSGETSALVGQVTNAIITVYSYDYTQLSENEAAARSVITGRFARQFDTVFAPVKQRAPQEQAVVHTTVPAVAVTQLRGDRARLLMMVNQSGTRGPDQQVTGATARLVVDAERVAGRWKIAEVTPE